MFRLVEVYLLGWFSVGLAKIKCDAFSCFPVRYFQIIAMERGRKRKQTAEPRTEPLLELVPESGSSTSSNANANDPIERLADIMSTMLQTRERPTNLGLAKGDVVPVFNPEDREQSSELWLNKIEELREIFQWTEEATIYYALSKLSGLAEVWYKGLNTMKFSWGEWKQRILCAFPSTRDYYEILSEMMKRRKRFEESYSKYFYEKVALLNRCKITGLEGVSCILGGIDDVVVKASARAGNFQSPEDLFRYLSTLHDLPPSTSRPMLKPAFKNDRRMQVGGRREFRRNDVYPQKCFKCGKTGHLLKDCRQKRCDFCRNLGHVESECRIKKRKKEENVNVVA